MMAFGHCMLDSQIDLLFDLVYSGLKITVSAIPRSSSHMGYLDLIFGLVYSGQETTVIITYRITYKFLLGLYCL